MGQPIGIVVMLLLSLVSSFMLLSTDVARGSTVDEKIYTNLQSDYYCVRRLNLTHQIGCTSEPGGNIGIVWTINDESDIAHVLKDGPTPPYTVVLTRKHFTSENVLKFKEFYPDRISGVVLIMQNSTQDGGYEINPFSTDSACPNRYTGLYSNDSEFGHCRKQLWQKKSDVLDLLYQDIPFPIFLFTEMDSINKIMDCFETHNKGTTSRQADFPLCSAQLDSFMSAASNSDHCLYGRATVDDIFQLPSARCRPINKNNIFGYYKDSIGVKPINGTPIVSKRSIVMIATRMDSVSFFNHLAPGADSPVSSLVVLLAIAHALGKFKTSKDIAENDRNIVFAIFDSESLDYTGSGRMAYDMKINKLFRHFKSNDGKEVIKNTNLEGLDSIIELNQLALYPNTDGSIYIHTDPSNYQSKLTKINTIVSAFKTSKPTNFIKIDPSMPLPPSSIQSFLRLDQGIAGLVLTNHQKEYTNLLYHSIYDDIRNINRTLDYKLINHLTDIATSVARVLYTTAFGDEHNHENIVADTGIVKQLLECYLIDSNCPLIKEAIEHSTNSIFRGPIDMYDNSYNSLSTQLLLSYFLGDKQPHIDSKECYEMSAKSLTHRYIYVNGDNESKNGICIRSQVLRTPSMSPAFQYEEVKLNETMIREFSTWTESDKNIRNGVRLFFRTNPLLEWITFLSGFTLTICSFVAVSLAKKTILRHSQIPQASPT